MVGGLMKILKFSKLKSNKYNVTLENGDVLKLYDDVIVKYSLIRYKEIKESISMVKKIIAKLKEYKNEPIIVEGVNNKFLPDSMVVSIVEGWRGEVVHIAITGANNELLRYKIKDPSFNNWYMLAMAVRNNGISDFPLCNKSFNLSYCGNDL